jgi:probable F420-dependent oxidoreductase
MMLGEHEGNAPVRLAPCRHVEGGGILSMERLAGRGPQIESHHEHEPYVSTDPPKTKIEFALQASLADAASWRSLAARAETAGFAALLVADHPGLSASPFVALAAAASATSTITLGTYVLNTGVRDPVHVASDVATLDVVSGGRALLGLGAGHTPAEWEVSGLPYPSATTRVDELFRFVERVLVRLQDPEVLPRPVQPRIPLLLGGGNRRLLEYAVAHADIVGLSGLGRTLADGHSHEVRWSTRDVDALAASVRGAACVDVLVQHVEITGDREAATARFVAGVPSLAVEDLLSCPFVLIGTEDEIAAHVLASRERWGIDRFTVRANALDAISGVIDRLR